MKETMLLAVIMLIFTAGAAVAKDEFFIGQWCGPTEFTQEKFAEVAAANFTVAMVSAGSPEANIKALDLCQANKIKGLVCDERTYPPRGRGRRSADLTAAIDQAVADYSKHPALWGYYITDEPDAGQFNRCASVNHYLLSKDPAHMPFVNLLPTYASTQQLGASTYDTYVDQSLRVIGQKFLSFDHYALMADGSVRADYFSNMAIIRRQSIKHKVPFNYILLSVPHGPYKDVTEADLRWQVNTALAYGARGIMYFTYTTPSGAHDAIIDASGKPTAKYDIAKRINGELKKLSPTLMSLHSVAVFHTGTLPEGCKPLPEGGLIKGIKGGEFVIGQFYSNDGGRYAMIVNRSLSKAARATVAFSQPVAVYPVNPMSGREEATTVRNESGTCTWNTTFQPGQGRLVRIDTVNTFPVMYWEDNLTFRPRVMLNPSNQFANQIFGDNKEELYNEGMNMYMISEKIQKCLQQDGRVDAFISRNTQTQRTTLGEETRLSRALNCDLLLACHSDATGTADPGGGCWTFYNGDEGKKLANCVQTELISAIRTFYPEVQDRGHREHWYRLAVLYNGGCQGALTEFLFHTNPKEREMLKDAKYQDIMAQACAKGILKYFGFTP